MKSPSFYTYLLLRLLATLGVATAAVFCLSKALYYTAFFCGLLVLVLLLELFSHIKSYFSFYEKTITAILNNDFSSNFGASEKHSGYANLVKLYDVLKDRRHEKETQDIIYRSILNSMESAAIILYQNNNEWEVFFINDYFKRYFEVPSVTRWKYMEKHLPALFNLVESIGKIDVMQGYKLVAEIDEFYLPRVAANQKGKIDYKGDELNVVVTKVIPEVKKGRFIAELNFVTDKPINIEQGLSFGVRLMLSEKAKTTVIPRGSFDDVTGGKWIFVVNGNKAVRKEITLGRENPVYNEVLSGLKAGEKVITSNYNDYKEVKVLNIE